MKTFLPATNTKLLLAMLVVFIVSSAKAQVSGVVFRDYNANGTKDNTSSFNENGVKNIIVTAFNSSGVIIASYRSAATGLFTIPASAVAYNNVLGSNTGSVSVGTSVRIEFSGLQTGDYPAPVGVDNKGSLQFATAPAANINFAVNYPDEYSQINPRLATSVFKKGGAPANEPVLVSVDYTASGGSKNFPNISNESDQSQLGATYGLAYHRLSNTLFASSYQKRHTSYGSANSTGAIYKIGNPADNSNSGVSLFVDLNILYGSNVAGNNPHPNGSTDFTRDDASYELVGKIGFGDMDISEDGLNLWTINLKDRNLYKIPLGSDPYNPVAPVSSASISRYPLWNLCDADNDGSIDLATDNDIRPFAIKPYHGKVYIGVICSAESTPAVFSNLTARVFAFDPVNLTFTEVINFPLNYNRGNGNTSAVSFPNGVPAGSGYANANAANWRPWNDIYTTAATFQWSWYDAAWKEGGYSQPIFAGLDFDDAGNMIIGLRDRFGDMMGDGVYDPGGSIIMEADGNGDLLRAVVNGTGNGWNFIVSEATNGTEFFGDDSYGSLHEETSMGGLAIYHGAGHIINTAMDPVSNLSGGFDWTRFSDGINDRSYEVIRRSSGAAITSHMFAKANALGEIELLSDAAPVEVGNRIWFDANQDGLQGGNETGLKDITVELYADFNNDGIPDGAVLASVITNGSGEWYFNSSNIIDGDPVTPGNQPGLKFGAGYIVRIGAADWNPAVGSGVGDLASFFLTTADALSTGTPDIADSDATVTSGVIKVPQIRFIAGLAGQNNHNLDFGFRGIELPLNLLTFTGKKETGGNELKWLTVDEIDTDRFEVENSLNGINFSAIANIATNGNNSSTTNNYSYLHKNPAEGINYYRLKMIDIDGKYKYSPVIKINNVLEKRINIVTYPNPVSNEIHITIPAEWQNKKVMYEIYTATGRIVKRIETVSSSQTETMNVSSLSSGFYIVRVNFEGQIAQQKIIKQ
jgi:Secretion system C-terminal sorting domain/SdrD B-like domain